MDIETRLANLERGQRQQKVALRSAFAVALTLGCLGMATAASPSLVVADEIRSKKFVLVDETDPKIELAYLHRANVGGPALDLYDQHGNVATPGLENRPRIRLRGWDDKPFISLGDKTRKHRLVLMVDETMVGSQGPLIRFYDVSKDVARIDHKANKGWTDEDPAAN